MGSRQHEKDEYMERLWYMREDREESLDALKEALGEGFDATVLDELSSDGLVAVTADEFRIILTEKGVDRARRVIRAHRIAERLIHDVLGNRFESGACEFEHMIDSELVDSICTLLGHPRECPHGKPIPEGACCKRSAKTAESSVIPLTELGVGQSGRVAYVNYRNEQLFHKIDDLQIRPGVMVKLLQRYPSYVVEVESATIAMDSEVAATVSLWKGSLPSGASADQQVETEDGSGWRTRLRGRRRGRR
jgi:DtxR family Mn-dependent transcriptional regulator